MGNYSTPSYEEVEEKYETYDKKEEKHKVSKLRTSRFLYFIVCCFSCEPIVYTALISVLLISSTLSALILYHTSFWKFFTSPSPIDALTGFIYIILFTLFIAILTYVFARVIYINYIEPRVNMYLFDIKNSYLLKFLTELKEQLPFSEEDMIEIFLKYISNLLKTPKVGVFINNNGVFLLKDYKNSLINGPLSLTKGPNIKLCSGLPKWLIENPGVFLYDEFPKVEEKLQDTNNAYLNDIKRDLTNIKARFYFPLIWEKSLAGFICAYDISIFKIRSPKNIRIIESLAEQVAYMTIQKDSLWKTFGDVLLN